ncbi:transmembrane signal receptor [Lithospermum erythrorhizon]|uniref:Transmembrane signal receptor n=1 Tax=Lithospermum erythrorhizon TaxID=34254 RepID=A0AAV3P3I0_LITER
MTVRMVVAISATKGWYLHQFDINNAFLHGYLDETIYITPPEGYQKAHQEQIYDHYLFILDRPDCFMVLVVYVDDILLASSSEEKIRRVKDFLHDKFIIKDLGVAKYFLGIKIARAFTGMYITQRKYITDNITNLSTAAATLFVSDWNSNDENSGLYHDPSAYRRLVGRLIYLNFTRTDLTYSVNILSQYMQASTQNQWNGVVHLVKYLKGSLNQGLFYPAHNNLILKAFCDVDWAKCTITRRSITRLC